MHLFCKDALIDFFEQLSILLVHLLPINLHLFADVNFRSKHLFYKDDLIDFFELLNIPMEHLLSIRYD